MLARESATSVTGMSTDARPKVPASHRFLDEAGDTTFYGKGRASIIGKPGVSLCFILGMVKFQGELPALRAAVRRLQSQVEADPYLRDVPSVQKKQQQGGFYFHATDDPPEVRKVFFEFIHGLDCSFEAVAGRKIPRLFDTKHHNRESEFYADLLSHLLKNKLRTVERLVLNIAARGKSTRNENLALALAKASSRDRKRKSTDEAFTRVVFNVQNPQTEPLLTVADYFCWSVQRVFERGEVRTTTTSGIESQWSWICMTPRSMLAAATITGATIG